MPSSRRTRRAGLTARERARGKRREEQGIDIDAIARAARRLAQRERSGEEPIVRDVRRARSDCHRGGWSLDAHPFARASAFARWSVEVDRTLRALELVADGRLSRRSRPKASVSRLKLQNASDHDMFRAL